MLHFDPISSLSYFDTDKTSHSGGTTTQCLTVTATVDTIQNWGNVFS